MTNAELRIAETMGMAAAGIVTAAAVYSPIIFQ